MTFGHPQGHTKSCVALRGRGFIFLGKGNGVGGEKMMEGHFFLKE